jgi:glutamine phosphoribosylpyrophosphate amidotransferase
MNQSMKQIIDVLNSVPKANLNFAMQVYDRYSVKFDDGIFENTDEGKVFILPFIVKNSLGSL